MLRAGVGLSVQSNPRTAAVEATQAALAQAGLRVESVPGPAALIAGPRAWPVRYVPGGSRARSFRSVIDGPAGGGYTGLPAET